MKYSFKTPKQHLAAIAGGLFLASALSAQVFPTTWTGGDGASINDGANWSDGLPTGLDAGEWGLVDTPDSLTTDSFGTNTDLFSGYRVWLRSGDFSTASNNRLLMDDVAFAMEGGSFTHVPVGSGQLVLLRDGASLDLRGGTTVLDNPDNHLGLAFGAGGSGDGVPRVDISGGTHTWGNIEFRQPNEGLNLLEGSYTLTLTGSEPIDLGRNHINFRFHEGGGSLIVSAFDANDPYDFEGLLWDDGELTFIDAGGNEFTHGDGTFSDYFIVSGGNTLTAIPEPSAAAAVLGVAVLGLFLHRRRMRS